MIADINPPVRMFLVSARMGSPFAQEQNAGMRVACPNCKHSLQLKIAGGTSNLLSRQQIREAFEKIGTMLSMNQNVMAGAAFKELGDECCTWCDLADVGEVADLVTIATTITRAPDDFVVANIARIGVSKPAMRLVGVG